MDSMPAPKAARRALVRPLQQADLFAFSVPLRVYFDNTDAGGVVYHSEYLKFLERARTEWLRHLGFDHPQLARKYGMVFVASNVAVDFLKPARLDDSISVGVQIESLGRVRVVFHQEIKRESGSSSELLVRARVTIACISNPGFKPMEIPEEIRKKLEAAT